MAKTARRCRSAAFVAAAEAASAGMDADVMRMRMRRMRNALMCTQSPSVVVFMSRSERVVEGAAAAAAATTVAIHLLARLAMKVAPLSSLATRTRRGFKESRRGAAVVFLLLITR